MAFSFGDPDNACECVIALSGRQDLMHEIAVFCGKELAAGVLGGAEARRRTGLDFAVTGMVLSTIRH